MMLVVQDDDVVVCRREELLAEPRPLLGDGADFALVAGEEPEIPALPIALDLRDLLTGGIEHPEAATDREDLALEVTETRPIALGHGHLRPQKGDGFMNGENELIPFVDVDGRREELFVDHKAQVLGPCCGLVLGDADLMLRIGIQDVVRVRQLENTGVFPDEESLVRFEHHLNSQPAGSASAGERRTSRNV